MQEVHKQCSFGLKLALKNNIQQIFLHFSNNLSLMISKVFTQILYISENSGKKQPLWVTFGWLTGVWKPIHPHFSINSLQNTWKTHFMQKSMQKRRTKVQGQNSESLKVKKISSFLRRETWPLFCTVLHFCCTFIVKPFLLIPSARLKLFKNKCLFFVWLYPFLCKGCFSLLLCWLLT